MKKVKFNIVFTLFQILLINGPSTLIAQDTSAIDADKIAAVVVLDSFIVTADRKGFEVRDFIRYVMEDKSFYKAFKNLRSSNFHARNEMTFYKKSGKTKAHYQSDIQQIYDASCREMEVMNEVTTGKFYKRNGAYNFYTAKLYDRVFFTHGQVCQSNDSNNFTTQKNKKGVEKNLAQLKKLIFEPGHRVDVPIIGRRTAIFEPHMLPEYEYAIISGELSGVDCYIFIVDVKPNVEKYSPGKTVIKHMETYFEKETFQVMGRNYHLSYEGIAFSFDVKMEIKLTQKNGKYLPLIINYDGEWSVPFQKKENGTFRFEVLNFE